MFSAIYLLATVLLGTASAASYEDQRKDQYSYSHAKASIWLDVGPHEIMEGTFFEAGGELRIKRNVRDTIFKVKLPNSVSNVTYDPVTPGSYVDGNVVYWPLDDLTKGTKIEFVIRGKAHKVGHLKISAQLKSGNKKLAYHETKVAVFKDETDSVHDALKLWLDTVVSHGPDVAQRTADLYEYEAVFLPTLSRTIRQQDAIREYFDFFANLPGLRVVPTVDPPVIIIKQYSSYMANADGFVYFARSDTTAITMARFSFAYRKNYKGEWKITLHHNSRIPDFNAAVKEVENINFFPPTM